MIRCITLFDITYNGQTEHKKNQLRNWHTLLQTLSIRSNVTIYNYPKMVFRDVNGLDLGSDITGSHNVWIFDFELDNPQAVSANSNALYLLQEDLDKVPMIGNLENTFKFDKNCLLSSGPNQNICIFSI